MGFTISFKGVKDYTPYEGMSDTYPIVGLTFGTIVKVEEGEAKKPDKKTGVKNKLLIVTVACDQTEAKGKKATKWIPVTGERDDGQPNVVGLLDVLTSAFSEKTGPTDEGSAKAIEKARSLDGNELESDEIKKTLMGQKVFYDIAPRKYVDERTGEDRMTTELKNFVVKQRWHAENEHGRAWKPFDADEALKAALQRGNTGGARKGGGSTEEIGGKSANGAGETPAAETPKPKKGSALGLLD